MKKIFCLMTAILISICIAFGGCTFIVDNSGGLFPDSNGQTGIGGGLGGGSSLTPVETATGLEFETLAEREELSLADAVSKVERTSVVLQVGSGYGSGVIVGVKQQDQNIVYIITCHHVISNGGNVIVYLPDENCNYDNEDYIFEGVIGASIYSDKAVTLVGGDNVSDIAVIKIDLTKNAKSGNKLSNDKIVRAVVPSSNYNVRKGESIFAIGNPTGKLPGSVTSGVVSYLGRNVLIPEVGNMELIQIDVATNPGSSGGGLYNLYGELIGITNAGNTNYGGINYAIPYEMESGNGYINIAKHLIKSCTQTNYGKVPNRWNIGIEVNTGEQQIGFSKIDYLYVSGVQAGSNADGKLNTNDVINKISWNYNGVKTYDIMADGVNFNYAIDAFVFCVSLMRTELEKGDSFIVNVSRSGYSNTIDVTINISVADYIFCNTGN